MLSAITTFLNKPQPIRKHAAVEAARVTNVVGAELRAEVPHPLDRPGDELREERDVGRVREQVALGADAVAVDVDDVRDARNV